MRRLTSNRMTFLDFAFPPTMTTTTVGERRRERERGMEGAAAKVWPIVPLDCSHEMSSSLSQYKGVLR